MRIRAIDETSPVLIGISRTMGGMRREITALRAMLKLLAADEMIGAETAELFGDALAYAIPVIGLAAGLISMAIGMTITSRRAAIPIGQTAPGQARALAASGPIFAHAGEVIGRPMPFPTREVITERPVLSKAPAPGAAEPRPYAQTRRGTQGDFVVQAENINLVRDGEDPESVGRSFAHVRAGVLSTELPAS